MLAEFREFINRGNFVDLAVAFVMGIAVANVVTALVDRVIMPLIGMIVGEPDFDAVLTFADGEGSVGAVLTALINFLLVAFVLFLIVRAYNRIQRPHPEEPEPEAEPEDVTLLREIRDVLASGATSTGGPGDDGR
jgi:large conductance mechanosensitive channel